MITEPSPRAISMDLGMGYWIAMLSLTGVVIFGWFALGPGEPAVAMAVVGCTYALGPGVAIPVMRLLPRRWFRVSAGERVLHRMLGVGVFGWLLDRSGWNQHFGLLKVPSTRTGIPFMELSVRGCFSAKGTCFAIHTLLAVVALFTGHPWGALWILLPSVVVHLYPALLQRSIMLRLQPLLEKSDPEKNN